MKPLSIKFSVRVPRCILDLFARRLLRRAEMFGRAGRDWRHGKIISGSVEIEADGRSRKI